MHRYTKIGVSLLFSSFLMWLIVVSQFTSVSKFGPFLSHLGEISFIAFIPTFVIGLFFVFRSKK